MSESWIINRFPLVFVLFIFFPIFFCTCRSLPSSRTTYFHGMWWKKCSSLVTISYVVTQTSNVPIIIINIARTAMPYNINVYLAWTVLISFCLSLSLLHGMCLPAMSDTTCGYISVSLLFLLFLSFTSLFLLSKYSVQKVDKLLKVGLHSSFHALNNQKRILFAKFFPITINISTQIIKINLG